MPRLKLRLHPLTIRPARLGRALALAVLVAAEAFNQLFLVVDSLPGTVPPALVLLAFELGRHQSRRL